MSNIFDMFEEDIPEGYVEVDMKSGPKVDQSIATELELIFKKHGVDYTKPLCEELSSLWADPPPWAPWAK
ncbi:hypothetical protein KNT70_gp019 [Cronobacter phage Pet-CM3-4]|uniref:Uncharacterized protein n=3 Tax=Karamvirus TaxID=1913650 RepID=A0A1D3RKD2_9CAUD|nr:hypothetical protein CG98_gp021 [Enterobacter phage PG7]YP_010091634.1 hypothetical protein KNT70_gp019 [Cronobacter phage Pet-CM3-4]QEG13062.1 hypothetical protein KAALPHA_25 [Klebsiella phage vB_KaeM_KaAlpha]USL85991.1 hypothetical protein [Enterobacter phage fGh-Ecl04]AHI60924.1 hypothetical protein PG7_021 [Enterobacter phage PG7]SCN45712.1 hypothetical protein [Cronobacter phage Pet-CM3-4]